MGYLVSLGPRVMESRSHIEETVGKLHVFFSTAPPRPRGEIACTARAPWDMNSGGHAMGYDVIVRTRISPHRRISG